jgi:hypothetical protein
MMEIEMKERGVNGENKMEEVDLGEERNRHSGATP